MDGQTAGEKSRNVVERMLAVMAEVGSIGKGREAPGLKYKFRGIDDITPVVQPLFVKHGVVLTQRVVEREREVVKTSAGTAMFSVRLLVEHTFRAPDGSTVVTSSLGEAMDGMDKATNKAMTAALKATLTTSFTIPVNDPEADTEASPQVQVAAPAAKPAPRPAQSTQRTNAAPRPAQASSGRSGTLNFPPYGRAKGQPIAGASAQDLDFYANGARRSLADPSKSNFHAKERALLEAIEAEQRRQSGASSREESNGDHHHHNEQASQSGADDMLDEPPPPGDEDAPF